MKIPAAGRVNSLSTTERAEVLQRLGRASDFLLHGGSLLTRSCFVHSEEPERFLHGQHVAAEAYRRDHRDGPSEGLRPLTGLTVMDNGRKWEN